MFPWTPWPQGWDQSHARVWPSSTHSQDRTLPHLTNSRGIKRFCCKTMNQDLSLMEEFSTRAGIPFHTIIRLEGNDKPICLLVVLKCTCHQWFRLQTWCLSYSNANILSTKQRQEKNPTYKCLVMQNRTKKRVRFFFFFIKTFFFKRSKTFFPFFV